jgi:nucleotide-binding universal stress UspA family protein
MNISRILLPVDGSEFSDRACEAAIDMAKAFGADILVLNCREDLPGYVSVYLPKGSEDGIKEKSREVLARYAEMLEAAGISHQAVSSAGRPSRLIAETAEEENIDLIVMGSRGKRGLAEFLVGPVTHEVLLASQKPVLVIH